MIEVWSDTEWLLQGVGLPHSVKCATGSLPVHGQFNGVVGSVNQWERCQRCLERILEISPHQSLRNVGSQVCTPIFQVRDTVAHCTPFMRQHNCGELSTEGGKNSISGSLPSSMGNSPDLPGLADSPACNTHSTLHECDSRQSVTLQASVHRVAD